MAFEPARDRASSEAFYTARRITELRLRPVVGSFDVAHLQEINRRIFQDLPGLGYDDVTPGQFRSPAPVGKDWVKHRVLDSARVSSHVAYSPMDEASQERLWKRLTAIDLEQLRGLRTEAFSRELGQLYSELDYIHPFSDGNSRTLREYTRHLADAAGFNLHWETFAQSKGGRDVLYVARDLAVNRLAVPHLQNDDTRRDVLFTLDQLEGNRDLTELLASAGNAAIRPTRAAAFEGMQESAVLTRFPELAPLYGQLRDAEAQSVTAFAQSPEAQAKFVIMVRGRMQAALDAGDMQVDSIGRKSISTPDRGGPER